MFRVVVIWFLDVYRGFLRGSEWLLGGLGFVRSVARGVMDGFLI